MEQELMDREVLCILDTRQIQQFMFRSNSYLDTLGGSDLMTHILDDGIRFALEHIDPPLRDGEYDLSLEPNAPLPFFEDRNVLFQLMTSAAGNAMFLARSGSLAQKIIRKISRYYLDHGYSLNLAAAAVGKSDDLGHDIFELYKKLNNNKTSAVVSNPLGALPVVMRENRTGEPVICRDEAHGDFISRSSLIRRQEAERRGLVVGFEELCATRGTDGKLYGAALHVDGNNVGITLGRMLQQTQDYQKGIRMRRQINGDLKAQYARIMEDTVARLRKEHMSLTPGGRDFAHDFQIIHVSGDDVNCICNASLAFPFLNYFFDNLRSAYLSNVDGLRLPLYCCAGICFAPNGTPFHTAFMMAQECCENAKAVAKQEKNLRNGLAGNWVDFMICENNHFQNLALLRERSYITESNVNLMLRPYCLDEAAKDQEYAYGRFLNRVEALRRMERKYGRRLLTRLRENYLHSDYILQEGMRLLNENGTDLEEALGAPFYRDEGGNTYATWYDALKVLPFIHAARSGRGGMS